MVNLDEKGYKILELLKNNSRTPYTEIADLLGVSEGTVRKRVKRMEDQGIIRDYTIDINPDKLGYRCVTLLGLDTTPEDFLNVVQTVGELEEVKWVARSTGDHMIMAEVWTQDDAELTEFIDNKISTIEGVKRICPAIILEKMK